MARQHRSDSPGRWFHVMNRGIARRTLFERADDMRFFRLQLREASERGELEVHAYCMMTTHFHLLIRSPSGQLASGMQRVQTEYSRWFNRGRKRDGPLVRGRYCAKPVRNDVYRRVLVRYIDRNPVAARLVRRASEYRHGSAREYAGAEPKQGSWLKRDWVEAELCRRLELEEYDPARYDEVYGKLTRSQARVVESRWGVIETEDPLEDLIVAAPGAVLAWMKRKAALADGTRPGLPVLALGDVNRVLRERTTRGDSKWKVGRRSGWAVLRVGLARQLCGLRFEEIGERVGLSRTGASEFDRVHRRLLGEDEAYAALAGEVATRALQVWERGGK